MSLLILQIVIKQWDKSQRTSAHILQRAKVPDKYPLILPPAFYVFDKQCIIDQHGDDIQGNRVKYSQASDGMIIFDRFQVCLEDNIITYQGAGKSKSPRTIGSLDHQWIQCKYNCRYSIFESDMYYWLYEELTVNAICLSKLDVNVFVNTEPLIIYEDFNDLDNVRKL